MNLFWKRGYENTSYDEIISSSGSSRYGLYQEFGDKQKLFGSVLDYYTQNIIMKRMKGMRNKNAGLEEIKVFFRELSVDSIGSQENWGCLVCNSAVYEAKHYPTINELTKDILAEMQEVFQHVIQRGVHNKEVIEEAIHNGLAGILLAQLVSMNVLSPTADNQKMFGYMVKGVERLIDSYKK